MTDYLEKEIRLSFDFFWQEANQDEKSLGYGLVRDRTSNLDRASIASVGFALSAYIIGVERGYISYNQGKKRVLGTLKTLNNNVPNYKGFFVHFAHMVDATRFKKCEYSTIDTAIVLNGVLSIDAYFEDETIHELSRSLVSRVDWDHFVFDYKGKKTFRMAYNPDRDGDYHPDEAGWVHQWDMPAEQLMMYLLAAGSPHFDKQLANELYFGFNRYVGGYGPYQFVYTPGGALFIYQFSHAFFDFNQYVDAKGFDWFKNSQEASLSNQQWCMDHSKQFKTLNDFAWGLTACDHPYGYSAFGTPPFGGGISDRTINCNGTVAPYGSISSIIFTPKESLASLTYFYEQFPELLGKYGLKDSYNLDTKTPWFSDEYIGIDKGITLLMLDNYTQGTTQKYYMSHPIVKRAINVLGFRKKDLK